MKKGFSFWFDRFVYGIGFVTLVVALAILGLIGFSKIEYALANRPVNQGVVMNKAYYDGHEWYSMWTFGDYSISKKCGGEPYFYVNVSDGKNDDFWTVTEEQWMEMQIGDFVTR